MNRTMHALHRWLGLVAGLLILVAAATALGLNHQDVFRGQRSHATSPFQKGVLSIAADPADPTRILAGTGDGLFRSRDGGATWEEAVLPVPAEGTCAILFDPARPGVVYVALRAIGVLRSDDHGDVWEDVALPFYPPEGTRIAGMSLERGGALLLATTEGLYRQSGPGGAFAHVVKAAPLAPEASKRWFHIVHDLHDGRFWGSYGVPVTDAVSIALIVLVASGYFLFFLRALQRWRVRRAAVTLPATPRAAIEPGVS